MYNEWFLRFAPQAYRKTRAQTTKDVETMLTATKNLTDVGINLMKANPSVLPSLRMSTCPPIAMGRLVGLAGISRTLLKLMEKENRLPLQMSSEELDCNLKKLAN